MSISANNDMLIYELNGFLRGIAVFSSMFVKSGECHFEFKKISADALGQKMLKSITRENFAFELDRWFAYGINDFMSMPEEKLAAAYHREMLERASDARDHFIIYLNEKLFRNKKWEVLYAEEKIEDAKPIQDEYLFKGNGEIFYLRLGWSE